MELESDRAVRCEGLNTDRTDRDFLGRVSFDPRPACVATEIPITLEEVEQVAEHVEEEDLGGEAMFECTPDEGLEEVSRQDGAAGSIGDADQFGDKSCLGGQGEAP